MADSDTARANGWRWRFVSAFGPGAYPGFLLGDWLRLLGDNRFKVSPVYGVRAASATANALFNSPVALYERLRYGAAVERTSVAAPLFILGHWRSGTTFLHQLLALDEQFAFPNLFQVSWPLTFLSSEALSTQLTRFLLPPTRPFDNVRQTWQMPNEDEIATAIVSRRSPYLSGLFPRRTEYYDRYLTFSGVPEREVAQWRAGLLLFLKKLTYKYQRPLVLKSPPHTGRIRLLLEMFPDARFVHIHRHPCAVFQSTLHLIEHGLSLTCFQRPSQVDWVSRTIRVYAEMYESFFTERSLIPDGQLHELAYEDLAKEPVGQVRSIYETLGIKGFDQMERRLRDYLQSISGYRTNRFPDLSNETLSRISASWLQSFDEWGYAIDVSAGDSP